MIKFITKVTEACKLKDRKVDVKYSTFMPHHRPLLPAETKNNNVL